MVKVMVCPQSPALLLRNSPVTMTSVQSQLPSYVSPFWSNQCMVVEGDLKALEQIAEHVPSEHQD
eukprot:12455553-Prorocentrum_lima.AAC.1